MAREKKERRHGKHSGKAIITVVGKDTVGIIAKICTYLANNRVNVLDISQTIVQGFFNMMMIVDLATSEKPFDQIQRELAQIGEGDRRGCEVPAGRNF